MKKIISAILIAIFVLSGCGSSADASDVSIDADRVQEANLDVWMAAGKNSDWFENAVDSYNKEFGTNITVTFTDVAPADIVAKATPMLSANQEMPELLFIQDANINDIYSQFPDAFVNLTDYGLGDEYWSNFAPAKIEMMEDITDGNMYGFPVDLTPTMVFYRQDLFEEVGIDYDNDIKSIQDLFDAGQKIYDETGVKMLGIGSPADSGLFKILLGMQDQIYYKDGKFQFDSEEAKNAAELTVAAAQNEATNQYVTGDMAGATQQQSSFTIQGAWWGGTNERDNPDQAGDWRVGALPPFAEGDEQIVPINGGSSVYVSTNSDQAQAALQVAEYIYSDAEVTGDAITRGIVTANLPAYDTDFAGQKNEYYGGQEVSNIYMNNFENIGTDVNNNISTIAIGKIIGAELGKAADGSQTVDEALDAIQKQCEATVEVPEE